jgi:hypothetical protein
MICSRNRLPQPDTVIQSRLPIVMLLARVALGSHGPEAAGALIPGANAHAPGVRFDKGAGRRLNNADYWRGKEDCAVASLMNDFDAGKTALGIADDGLAKRARRRLAVQEAMRWTKFDLIMTVDCGLEFGISGGPNSGDLDWGQPSSLSDLADHMTHRV